MFNKISAAAQELEDLMEASLVKDASREDKLNKAKEHINKATDMFVTIYNSGVKTNKVASVINMLQDLNKRLTK